jgi:hypothetical protein
VGHRQHLHRISGLRAASIRLRHRARFLGRIQRVNATFVGRRGFWVASLFLLLTAAACTIFNSLDGYTRTLGPDAGDAGTPPPACARKLPPGRPDAAPEFGRHDGGLLVFAVRTYELERQLPGSDAGLPPDRLGYDLDGKCTCPEERSCLNGDAPLCDAEDSGGVDNHSSDFFTKFLSYAKVLDGGAQVDPNALVKNGVNTILLELSGWNGEPNDDRVTVRANGSGPLERSSHWGGLGSGIPIGQVDGGAVVWDGQDTWMFRDVDAVIDDRAYVSDGELVSTAEINLQLGSLKYAISGGIISASLEKSDGGYRLARGLVTGRIGDTALLTALGGIAFGGESVCEGSEAFKFAKSEICGLVDIAEVSGNDNEGRTCRALSVGIGFVAELAKRGKLETVPPTPKPCLKRPQPYAPSCLPQ